MKILKQSLNTQIILKKIGTNSILALTKKNLNIKALNKVEFSKSTILHSSLFPTSISKNLKFPITFRLFSSWLEYHLEKSLNPFFIRYKNYLIVNKKIISLVQDLLIFNTFKLCLNSNISVLKCLKIFTL